MVARNLRYNLKRKLSYKDFETNNCFWGFSSYHDHYLGFLLERRHLYKNVHEIAKINALELSISNKNVSVQNFDALISNFFFLRFFTGKKPYFLPVKVISSFQEKRYSYTCQVQLKREEAFFFFQNMLLLHQINYLFWIFMLMSILLKRIH